MVREVHYGVRYLAGTPLAHEFDFGTDEALARRAVELSVVPAELVRSVVTRSEWVRVSTVLAGPR